MPQGASEKIRLGVTASTRLRSPAGAFLCKAAGGQLGESAFARAGGHPVADLLGVDSRLGGLEMNALAHVCRYERRGLPMPKNAPSRTAGVTVWRRLQARRSTLRAAA
jgi:hypothetical protein